jgi:hypothetical protein
MTLGLVDVQTELTFRGCDGMLEDGYFGPMRNSQSMEF